MKALKALLPLSLVLAAQGGLAAEASRIYQGHPHDAFFGVHTNEDGFVAVGAGGLYSRSSDGVEWQHEAISRPDISLLAVSERGNNALAVGQSGVVLRRTGDGWVQSDTPTKERLLSVALGDGGLAMAVGGFGTVLRSLDSGVTWTKLAIDWEALIQQPYEPHVYNCIIDDSGNILMVGEFGMIARSSDGGTTWQAHHTGEESLFGVAMNSDGVGIAVGQSGIVLRSADAGLNWQRLDSGSESILLDAAVRQDGAAVVSGIREALSVSSTGEKVSRLMQPVFLEDWYVDVAVRGQDFFLVGQRAQVVKVKL